MAKKIYGEFFVVKKSYSVSKEVAEWVEKKGGRSASKFVNEILTKAMESDKGEAVSLNQMLQDAKEVSKGEAKDETVQ